MVLPVFTKVNDMMMLVFVKFRIKYHIRRLKSDYSYDVVSISQKLFKRMALVWTSILSTQILIRATVSN